MYTVVILAEQALSDSDAAEVVSLHEDLGEPRRYHVVIPCDDAKRLVQHTLGTLAASEVLAPPPILVEQPDLAATQEAIDRTAENAVDASVAAIKAHGQEATGEFDRNDPIETLEHVAAEKQAAEIIVMTRPHVIAELLHIDWASKARRHLGVPVLHLLEHEPLDIEAGYGQGITGM
jgi:hypothetical protein